MSVRKAVDARQCGTSVFGLVNIEPANLRFPGAGLAEPFAGPFDFGQRANSALPQSRNKRYKNLGRCNCVTQRAVAIMSFDIDPAGDGVE